MIPSGLPEKGYSTMITMCVSLQASGFPGPLILHGLAEGQVDAALQFLSWQA